MTKSFTKEIDVALTDTEWEERSKMLGVAIEDLEKAKAKAKESASAHGTIVKAVDKKVHDLGRAVRERKEERSVLCVERENTRLFRWETVRLDTEEIIDVRPMNDEDLSVAQQPDLFDRDQRAANEPGDSHTLPNHPVLETIRAPDQQIACPGPDGSAGCEGEECSRCAGLLHIPNPDASDHDEEGTAITDPGALAAAGAAPPDGKRRRGLRAEAH